MRRTLFNEEHDMFREAIQQFIEREIAPYYDTWEKEGLMPREVFEKAGQSGFLGMDVPEQYGGGGATDFLYNMAFGEELAYAGFNAAQVGLTLHNDICVPYFLTLATEEQKQRWLPGMCTGEKIAAIAMTEPGIGSDLASMSTTAIKDGDSYIVNGSKTFITNGINADLVITAVKTDPTQKHKGMSLIVIERGMEGFERGRNLEKIGMHSQDTAELFFTDVRVPAENLLGTEGHGFLHLVDKLAQERLNIAIAAVAASEAALRWTLEYTKERTAFGKPVATFQNSRFKLAEMRTEIDIAQTFLDACVDALNRKELTGEDAAKAKWWTTELQKRVVDTCLQLHGGYGYMLEYPISRAYLDARITSIYGGTTEIMKEIIGKSLGV